MPGPHASVSCCANSGNPCSHQPPRPHQLPPVRNLPRPKNSPRGCFCPAVRWTRGPGFSIPAWVTFYARHLLKSAYKEKSTTSNEVVLFGDPCGNRTDILYVFALQFFVLTYNLQFDIVFNVSSRYLLWCRTVVFPYLSPPSLQSMQRGGFFVLIILLQIFNSFIMF